MFHFRSSKMFIVVLVVLVLATSAYAFAATNTVPASRAGEGSGAISGYTVSNIVYTFDTSNPSDLTNVAFSLDAAAATVKVSLTAAGTLQACTNPSGNNWTCALTGVTVTGASSLRVVASQ
ncbi:MAG TPA: hypothetical protein VFI68_04375 [Anaerolineales bacterium]|nr:hypothetical protein [Anaerolineales bacterium]